MEEHYAVWLWNGDKPISSFYFCRKKDAISKFNELVESCQIWNSVEIYHTKLLDRKCPILDSDKESKLCAL